MFTVKLASGTTFAASVASERFRSNLILAQEGTMELVIECPNPEHDLAWYKDVLLVPGATDTIVITSDEGESALTATGYNTIQELSMRLTPIGELYLIISLLQL